MHKALTVTGLLSTVRKCQILNRHGLPRVTNSILNTVLHLIQVYYFHMNTKETKLKKLTETRFGSMIFLLRMAGIPFKMNKILTIYVIYMRIVIICASTTYLGMFVNVYNQREDLGRAMTTVRMLIPLTNVMWIFSFCR
jgi:hypothetical protein